MVTLSENKSMANVRYIYRALYDDPKLGTMVVFFSSEKGELEDDRAYLCYNPTRNLEVACEGRFLTEAAIISCEVI